MTYNVLMGMLNPNSLARSLTYSLHPSSRNSLFTNVYKSVGCEGHDKALK